MKRRKGENNYREQIKEYDSLIKKKYKPIISKSKMEELQKIKSELKMSPREKVRRSSPVVQSDKEELRELALKRRKIFEWKNPMKPPTPEPRKSFEQKNFLKEFHQEMEDEFQKTGKRPIPPNKNWQQDLEAEKYSKTERYNIVKEKASMLEKTAREKQKYLSLNGGGTARETEEVNDMLFDSLNAKLSLLKSAVTKEGEEQYN